jgi:hypothetical protein
MKRKLSPTLILTATIAGVIALGCAAARGADDRAPARGTPSEKTSPVKISIKLDEKTLTATLHDNATSKDFVSLLPLRLTLKNYAATEKVSDLPKRLSTEGAPAGSDPDVGDIAYYAPWGNLAIFYKDFGYSNGLIILGKIDGDVDALMTLGEEKATIELIK